MATVYKASGDTVVLNAILARGGEGEIWQTAHPDVVVKLYHKGVSVPVEKLETMIAAPPHDPTIKSHHVSIAWPQEIIYDTHQKAVGFLMPRVSGSLTLSNIYNPKLRRRKAPGFNFYYLHTTAYNIASIIDSLHARGYVVGDVKTENFLVNDKALCALSDTDSMQVPHGENIFRCTVGSEGFTPPELIGQDFYTLDRTEHHDRFGLAILIHLLLLGTHPFTGTWAEGGEPLSLDQAIMGKIWPYGTGKRLQPSMLSVSLDVLAPNLKEAFLRAFNGEAEDRPAACEWKEILHAARHDLHVCALNGNHYYDYRLSQCPWCLRSEKLGIDIYPNVEGYGIEHKVRFDKACKTEDQRLMVRLWLENEILRQSPEYTHMQGRMQKIEKDIALLDQFKENCQKAVGDDLLFQMIADNPRLETLAAFPHEKIGQQPLAIFFRELEMRRKAIARVQDATRTADQSFMAMTSTLAHEQAVIETTAGLCQLLLEQGREASAVICARSNEAMERIEAWHMFVQSQQGTDIDLWHVWQKFFSKLKGFALSDDMRMHLDQVQKQYKLYDMFISHIRTRPYEDKALLDMWRQYPAFQKTIFSREKIFREKSISDFVEMAQKRQSIQPTLDQAYQTGDVQSILKVWDKDVCGYHPDFKKFKTYAEDAFNEQKKWHKVRRHILEEEPSQVVKLWHDIFTPQALREGLAEKIRASFQHEETRKVTFPTSYFPKMTIFSDFIDVIFPWPILTDVMHKTTRSPYVFGVAQANPQMPLDASSAQAIQVCYLKEDCCGEVGRLFWPKIVPQPHVFLWAADIVAGGFRTIGSPLYIYYNQMLPQIMYSFSVHKFWKDQQSKLTIYIDVNQDMNLPTLEIIATRGRQPIFNDPRGISLGILPACFIKKGRHKILIESKIPMERDMICRLQSDEPYFMDTVTLIYRKTEKHA